LFVEDLGRGLPTEDLARPVIECEWDSFEVLAGATRGVGAFGEVLASPIHVLVGAPLPWFAWVGEEHTVAEERRDLLVTGHLGPLIPRQCAPLVRRQLRHRCGECPVDL